MDKKPIEVIEAYEFCNGEKRALNITVEDIETMDNAFKSFKQLEANIQAAFENLANAFNKTVIPAIQEFIAFMQPYHNWQRMENESDDDYADRLVAFDLLDNPDARWEYQKIVLSTPIRLWRRFRQ